MILKQTVPHYVVGILNHFSASLAPQSRRSSTILRLQHRNPPAPKLLEESENTVSFLRPYLQEEICLSTDVAGR